MKISISSTGTNKIVYYQEYYWKYTFNIQTEWVACRSIMHRKARYGIYYANT